MTDASGREAILARLAEALERREPVEHPGRSPVLPVEEAPRGRFRSAFEAAGGTVVQAADLDHAAVTVRERTRSRTVVWGRGVPSDLRPQREEKPAHVADVGISLARGAVAETGSLLLDARDGRRSHLLPPRHLVLVPAEAVYPSLVDALTDLRSDLPSALGLHSGPSKSADIGQVMVQGVHGPGSITALLVPGLSRPPWSAA